ncbi:PTS sugar transporter subunit IIB [uncultured Anaerococcus sp.]|uniref:PTS sugar transporter subunit IIB n=1 Tax=uncultured Anaerococcus sp. TaxID=293428 RepID=UPI0028897071|nr:PTS sugar transporter subunit IIB [uncultured Anaerococcus sp.]
MSEKLDIVLCCSAGMSTSLVVEKMQDAAKEKGIDVEIKAVPVSSVEELDNSHKIDILLLGPQVKFKLNELKEVYKDQNTLVDVINMMDYGMINGEKILTDALKAYKKQ